MQHQEASIGTLTNTILSAGIQGQDKLSYLDHSLKENNAHATNTKKKARSSIERPRRPTGQGALQANPKPRRPFRKNINKGDIPHVGSKRKSNAPLLSDLPYHVRKTYINFVCSCFNVCSCQCLSPVKVEGSHAGLAYVAR